MTDNATRAQLQANHLWDRVVYAKKVLESYQTQYSVVYEDPFNDDNVAHVLHPDPHWMAMAMRGDIVPEISAYMNMPLEQIYERQGVYQSITTQGHQAAEVKHRMKLDGWVFQGEKVLPTHELHTAQTMPAMTEEQAIEYLIMKDVPGQVWKADRSNRPRFMICRRDQVPSDRKHRQAWRLAA